MAIERIVSQTLLARMVASVEAKSPRERLVADQAFRQVMKPLLRSGEDFVEGCELAA